MLKVFVRGVPLCLLLLTLGTGCAWTQLQAHNRRLKESNDRLITENNRLATELNQSRRSVSSLQQNLASLGSRPAVEAPRPEPAPVLQGPPVRTSANVPTDLLIPATGLPDEVSVERTARGVKLTLEDRVFFSSGQAELSKRGQQILRQIGQVLNRAANRNHIIRVDGHTDDIPVRKVRHIYPTNWELSTARACKVVRYLVEKSSVNPQRIFPAGFSFYKPVARATSDKARDKNRRVEITILNETV